MEKKALKSLNLKKNTISKLTINKISGGKELSPIGTHSGKQHTCTTHKFDNTVDTIL